MSTLAQTTPTESALFTGARVLAQGDFTAMGGARAATAGGRLLPKWLLRRISGMPTRRLK